VGAVNYFQHNEHAANARRETQAPERASQRPRDPRPGMSPDQVAHAEFILSTRETALTLEG
jgi:hypothetical protein